MCCRQKILEARLGKGRQLAVIALQQSASQRQLDADRRHLIEDFLHLEAVQIEQVAQQQALRSERQWLEATKTQLALSWDQAAAKNAAELAHIQAARDALAAESANRDEQRGKIARLSSKYALVLIQPCCDMHIETACYRPSKVSSL